MHDDSSALVGGEETKPVRQKLVRLRVSAQNTLRQHFEQAKSDGDLPEDADAAGLTERCRCRGEHQAETPANNVPIRPESVRH